VGVLHAEALHTACSYAIFTFKTCTGIDYYVKNSCTVNICAFDISKAFDRVDHYKLFNILIDTVTT